jgi:hypothetical protein
MKKKMKKKKKKKKKRGTNRGKVNVQEEHPARIRRVALHTG